MVKNETVDRGAGARRLRLPHQDDTPNTRSTSSNAIVNAPSSSTFHTTWCTGPTRPVPPSLNKTGKGLYADTVAEIDWSVGQILDRLVELEIDHRTRSFFLRPTTEVASSRKSLEPRRRKPPHASNAPYSGGKATPAEGGFRVPTIGMVAGHH